MLEILKTALVFTIDGFELRKNLFFLSRPSFAKRRDYVMARKNFRRSNGYQKPCTKRKGVRGK